MPKRNRVKVYQAKRYYHIYNRGANRQNIFQEPTDYFYFLSLIKRHLSVDAVTDSYGRRFTKFDDQVELVAFCLMPNNFHLLCYLKEPAGIVHLMRSVMTAYTMYFNKKYQRTGGLYEGPFLASSLDNEAYLWHVSRYIHLKPRDVNQDFRHYPYSSIAYFTSRKQASWLHASNLVKTDTDRQEYLEFVADYETMKQEMKYLKHVLAASP